MDADRIRPFWAAVLDYREQPDGSLADPRGWGAPVWFQQMDEPRTERNRFHVDEAVEGGDLVGGDRLVRH